MWELRKKLFIEVQTHSKKNSSIYFRLTNPRIISNPKANAKILDYWTLHKIETINAKILTKLKRSLRLVSSTGYKVFNGLGGTIFLVFMRGTLPCLTPNYFNTNK